MMSIGGGNPVKLVEAEAMKAFEAKAIKAAASEISEAACQTPVISQIAEATETNVVESHNGRVSVLALAMGTRHIVAIVDSSVGSKLFSWGAPGRWLGRSWVDDASSRGVLFDEIGPWQHIRTVTDS